MNEFALNRLRGFGFRFIDGIKKDLLENKKKASGRLIASTGFRIKEFTSLFIFEAFSAPYYEYVDKGRRPGKFPPKNKILQWINQKGIVPDGISKSQLAFLIGRKISKEGVEGTNIFSNAIDNYKNNFNLQQFFLEDIKKQTKQALTP